MNVSTLFLAAACFIIPSAYAQTPQLPNTLVISQNVPLSAITGSSSLTLPIAISPDALARNLALKNNFRLELRIKDIPDTISTYDAVTLGGVVPVVEPALGSKTLFYRLFLPVTDDAAFVPTAGRLQQSLTWSLATLKPLLLTLPEVKPGFLPSENNVLQLDFCPDSPNVIRYPFGRPWPYIRPNEPIRAVVRHVNPLRYAASLDVSALAFNTDPGAALSAVSGIFDPTGVLFKKTSFSQNDSDTENLRKLTSIANQIAQLLHSLKQKECLDEAVLAQLRDAQTTYNELLTETPDELSFKAKINDLANSVLNSLTATSQATSTSLTSATNVISNTSPRSQTSIGVASTHQSTSAVVGETSSRVASTTLVTATASGTTTVTSQTASVGNSFTGTASLSREQLYKRRLANYALDSALPQRTFDLLQRLDDAIAGSTLSLRPVSPQSYPGADVIRVTLTTAPLGNTTVAPLKQSYDLWVVGRMKVDFSAGLMLTDLADQQFSRIDRTFDEVRITEGKSTTATVTRALKGTDQGDKVSMALSVLAHLYWRLPCWGGAINPGFTAGSGITQKGRPIVLLGGSVLFGRSERIALSGGLVWGSQKQLSNRYDDPANYISSTETEFTYVDKLVQRWFVGLSFNWGSNQKIVPAN